MSEDTVVTVVQNKKRRRASEPKVSMTLKRLWQAEGGSASLKVFARKRVKEGDAIAKRWFENRAGEHDTPRSDKNVGLAKLVSEATKNSRRKVKK